MKRDDVVFLDVAAVEAFHAKALAVAGGAPGIRDVGLLDAAVYAPLNGYYDSLADIAAVYAHGIAKNHALVDGNKRTALYAALAFLEANGHALTLDRDKWRDIMLGVADGTVSRVQLADHFAAEMGERGDIDD